jgi:predicted dehydrogenase
MTAYRKYFEPSCLYVMIGGEMIKRKFGIVDEFRLEVNAFASAILSGRPVAPDGVQGHRDLVILNSIYESARKQAPVIIPC